MATRHTCGFTLIEITVVVAIVGILIAAAVTGFVRARTRASHESLGRTIQTDLVRIDAALQQYALEFDRDKDDPGTLPRGVQELADLDYFRAVPLPPIEGTSYGLPGEWSDFPFFDGCLSIDADYQPLYSHPDAVICDGWAN